VEQFVGHGVGSIFHSAPSILHYRERSFLPSLSLNYLSPLESYLLNGHHALPADVLELYCSFSVCPDVDVDAHRELQTWTHGCWANFYNWYVLKVDCYYLEAPCHVSSQ
jgi:hypothetical protein